MSDQEISNYLGASQQPPPAQHQPLPNPLASYNQTGLVSTAQVSVELKQSHSNISHQFDHSRSNSRAHLDSALGLASLHTYSSTHGNQPWPQQPHSIPDDSSTMSNHDVDTKTSPLDIKVPTSPTDSLVESSNPPTPAEHAHVDGPNKSAPSARPCCGSKTISCTPSSLNSHLTALIRPNDERTCEEAARIIASMRGSHGNPEEVMRELGCAEGDAKCSVKNVKVFQLMDRG